METLVGGNYMLDKEFYRGKKVLVTGHTGFKGSWMTKILLEWGAEVIGYSLENLKSAELFSLLKLEQQMNSIYGDIRDLDKILKVFQNQKPEIVIHMAAQPIVRESYINPVETYSTNVLGTVNILEAVRKSDTVCSVVNVTTDKVYKNKEWVWGYRENEELNGFDPYSNSKSCSELVTATYKKCFLDGKISVSTARAGNVIGGGDFAVDRIIPDCVRAVKNKEKIIVRNPYSIRPYQHVLEPVMAYLLIAQKQYNDDTIAGNYNVGPDEQDCISTGKLVEIFCNKWNQLGYEQVKWMTQYNEGPHEANCLKLDCSKIKNTFNWKPEWNVEYAVEKVVEWTETYLMGGSLNNCMEKQVREYSEKLERKGI